MKEEEDHASARRMEKRPDRGERPHVAVQAVHINTETQKRSHTAPVKFESQSPVATRATLPTQSPPPMSPTMMAPFDPPGEKERYEKELAALFPAQYGKQATASKNAEQSKGRAVPTGPRSELAPSRPPPVKLLDIPRLDPNRQPVDELGRKMQDLNRTISRQEAIRRNLYTEVAKNNVATKRAKHEMEMAEIEYMAAVARRKFICADEGV